jgi:phosphomannomutase
VTQKILISDLMRSSRVAFGTSGARGLVDDMTDRVCVAYTLGFVEHIRKRYSRCERIAIGGDHRPSTERILKAVAFGAAHLNCQVDYLGRVPSPAVALYGFTEGCPTVMVTGSHIPADRNGMKYTTFEGEFSKADEAAMLLLSPEVPDAFDPSGSLLETRDLGPVVTAAQNAYIQRYIDAFGKGFLDGFRLAVYGHSSVARDILCELYGELGAQVTRTHFSDVFVPVDTEAIRPEDVELGRELGQSGKFDAIVSTDGDADRPLIADENGQWFRGDVAGILTARFLGAEGVACPVSCNTALELSGSFPMIRRTRIGSPFVVQAMTDLMAEGSKKVVGYEANGGFLTATSLNVPGGSVLPSLPTRDPVVVHLSILGEAKRSQVPVSRLLETLPARFTASDRDPSFETARSRALIAYLTSLSEDALEEQLGLGPMASVDQLDGLRLTFRSGEILHYRPSGNAPELRCYSETGSARRAIELVSYGLEKARLVSEAVH